MAMRAEYNPNTGKRKMVVVDSAKSRAAQKAAKKRLRNRAAEQKRKRSLAKTRKTGRTVSGRKSNLK